MDVVSTVPIFDFSSVFSTLGTQLGSLLSSWGGVAAGVMIGFLCMRIFNRSARAIVPETFEERQARGKREVERTRKRSELYDVAAKQGFFGVVFDKRRKKRESVQEFRDRMRNNSEIQLRRSERLELQLLTAFNKHQRDERLAEKKEREERPLSLVSPTGGVIWGTYKEPPVLPDDKEDKPLSLVLPSGRVIWGTYDEPPVLPDEKFEREERSSSSSSKPAYEDWVA